MRHENLIIQANELKGLLKEGYTIFLKIPRKDFFVPVDEVEELEPVGELPYVEVQFEPDINPKQWQVYNFDPAEQVNVIVCWNVSVEVHQKLLKGLGSEAESEN